MTSNAGNSTYSPSKQLATAMIWAHSIATIALIVALGEWPYGYYQFLRLVVSPVFLVSCVIAFRCNLPAQAIPMAAIGLLFNPVEPVHLSRGVWAFIDLLAATGGMLLAARVYLPVFELRRPDSPNS